MGVDSFPLLSDFPDKEVIKAYGVLNERYKTAKRSYFLVGTDGKIKWSELANVLENDVVIEKIKSALNMDNE